MDQHLERRRRERWPNQVHRNVGLVVVGTNIRTASPVALWFNNNKFWLAVRPMRTYYGNQVLEIYNSTNGASWSSYSTSIGYKRRKLLAGFAKRVSICPMIIGKEGRT